MSSPSRPPVDTPLDRLLLAGAGWEDGSPSGGQREVPPRTVDHDRTTLERAKGALMMRYGVTSHEAFAMLARCAQTTTLPVVVLARALVKDAEQDRDRRRTTASYDAWFDDRPLDMN